MASTGIRILIADDSTEVRRGLREVLTLLGAVEVIGEAGDGREAVERAGRLRPDVVLMDLEMPGMDGLEAARRIRATCPGARIVILSARDDGAARREAAKAGADGFVVKGTPARELAALLAGNDRSRGR